MFISPAYAQGIGGGTDMFVQFVPIVLMFVIFARFRLLTGDHRYG